MTRWLKAVLMHHTSYLASVSVDICFNCSVPRCFSLKSTAVFVGTLAFMEVWTIFDCFRWWSKINNDVWAAASPRIPEYNPTFSTGMSRYLPWAVGSWSTPASHHLCIQQLPDLVSQLGLLYHTIESRVKTFHKLTKLHGKLYLLMSQVGLTVSFLFSDG